MSTAASLITLALKDIQVLDETETPSATLMADALTTLNQMLAMWQIERMFVYAQIDTTFAANGSTTYTVGTGGNFNIAAPARIDYAFLRVNSIDYPIEILSNWEEYQAIALKSVSGTFPEVLYYNPTYPLSTIYVYPQPTTGTLHLVSSVAFPIYSVSADSINLPSEYDMPIRFSLGEILAAMMGRPVRPDIARLAANSRKIIKANNLHIKALDLGGCNDSGYLRILRG